MAPLISLFGRPEYLIRFDDICPTINWAIWSEVERILIANDVAPILAVVPDNRDPDLMFGAPNPDFWDRVRSWQARGWTIGLHGYQHLYVTRSSGLIGLNKYSEFAGLPYEEQYRKLAAGIEIFRRESVRPDIWVAPAHSFDEETLRALRALNIHDVSDGFRLAPYNDDFGMFWIPQQLGNFHLIPAGVWTVCVHTNDPPHADLRSFARQVERIRPYLTTVPRVKSRYASNKGHFLGQAMASTFRISKRLLRYGSASHNLG